MTTFSRPAPPADHHLARAECGNPGCKAAPLAELRVPLCDSCARDVAFQWLALTHNDRHPDRPQEPIMQAERYEQGSVYFIRFGDRIKIGYSGHVEGRLRDLPHDEILAVMPGTRQDEARCHAAFAHLRWSGEWFHDAPDLRAFIEGIKTAAA